jgi:hypothetical protein
LKEEYAEKKNAVGKHRLQYFSKSPETQQLTVAQQSKEWLATFPDGKLPTC